MPVKKAILFLGLASICGLSFGQAETRSGIFFTIKCVASMPKYDVVLSAKPVCLTASPILMSSEFGQLTMLKETRGKIFFDLKLSAKGNETLMKLSANLPNSGLAVVVNDRVITVFNASDIKLGGTLRFIGNTRYRDGIILAHRLLQDHIGLPEGQ